MTMIAPGVHQLAHRSVAMPAKAASTPSPFAFASYLADPASTAMPERQSAWSFCELGVFGHLTRQGADPVTDAAAEISTAAPIREAVSDLRGTTAGISHSSQANGISGVSAAPDFSSAAALPRADFALSSISPLTDESSTVIQATMPETEYDSLDQAAEQNQVKEAERSPNRSFAPARGFTKNTGDIQLSVFGAGKFLQVSAFGDGLGVDARMRLRRMIDAVLERYGHTASSIYVDGTLQNRPLDSSFTSIIEGGTDGDHRG